LKRYSPVKDAGEIVFSGTYNKSVFSSISSAVSADSKYEESPRLSTKKGKYT
jgi:hypothetical protein